MWTDPWKSIKTKNLNTQQIFSLLQFLHPNKNLKHSHNIIGLWNIQSTIQILLNIHLNNNAYHITQMVSKRTSYPSMFLMRRSSNIKTTFSLNDRDFTLVTILSTFSSSKAWTSCKYEIYEGSPLRCSRMVTFTPNFSSSEMSTTNILHEYTLPVVYLILSMTHIK